MGGETSGKGKRKGHGAEPGCLSRILRGRREEDFAPIKNAEGVDSPESATKLYNDYWEKNANGRM